MRLKLIVLAVEHHHAGFHESSASMYAILFASKSFTLAVLNTWCRRGAQHQVLSPQYPPGPCFDATRQRPTVVTHAAADQYDLEPPVTREQLEDPAHIGASTTVDKPLRVCMQFVASNDTLVLHICPEALGHRSPLAWHVAQDQGGELSLDTYLDLPVEQYNRLDPDMIRPLGGGTYALQVPRVQVQLYSLQFSDAPLSLPFHSAYAQDVPLRSNTESIVCRATPCYLQPHCLLA